MKQSTFAEQLLFTTVRVETTRRDGRQYVGTAFIVSYEEAGGQLFLVTNKHVVSDMTSELCSSQRTRRHSHSR